MSNQDSIASIHKDEMRRLRRLSPGALLRPIFYVLCGGTLLLFLYFAFSTSPQEVSSVAQLRDRISTAGSHSARALAHQQASYQHWLEKYGMRGEVLAYVRTSSTLLGWFDPQPLSGAEEQEGFFRKSSVFFAGALLRVSFILLACWRLWLLVIAGSCLWTYYRMRPHEKEDMLGQSGNGRLYYSGIQVGLVNRAISGEPGTQFVGLACPKNVGEAKARQTSLGALLQEYEVDNGTNLHLAGIIAAYEEWPAFVAAAEDQRELSTFFSGASLLDASTEILRHVLELHESYRSSHGNQVGSLYERSAPAVEGNPMSLEAFGDLFRQSLDRVVTPDMRASIGQADTALIVTTILAYQAGKVMAYAHEGERWNRCSNFSQLTARAILHSVQEYGKDYDYDTRKVIRRALIYGSRTSVFGPVRFAKDLSWLSRALRQWVELLMACPHEMERIADEVELFGLASEGQRRWSEIAFDTLVSFANEEHPQVFATETSLLFLPVRQAVAIIRDCIPPEQLARMKELQALVSQKQQLRVAAAVQSDGEAGKLILPAYEKIYSPLGKKLVERLSKEHDIPEEELNDWSAFRVVLNAYGWLARRVGDYSVPESSVIFTVLREARGSDPLNELGLLGRAGMVPFRGTRFEERWGPDWITRFVPAQSANMAESPEHFSKLLRGIPDEEVGESDELLASAG